MLRASLILNLAFLLCLSAFSQQGTDLETVMGHRDEVRMALKEKMVQLSEDPGRKFGGEPIHGGSYLVKLYESNGYQPFWTTSDRVQDALVGLLGATDDGLLTEDYHLPVIYAMLQEIVTSEAHPDKLAGTAAELDLLISDGVMFYAFHLLFGKVDPVELEPTWNITPGRYIELDPEDFARNVSNGRVTEQLRQFRPDLPTYDTLMSALQRYREMTYVPAPPHIPDGGKIEPGQSDGRIPAIRQRLMALHRLTDTTGLDSMLYDRLLEKDIRGFQAMHGLDVDGVIGRGTFSELNVPAEDRVNTLRINMERTRWVARNLPEDYLIVNIAAFWLIIRKDGDIEYNTRVVVGKPFTKTPVFRDRIRYIEFNPTWTVPTSIVRKEIIPKLKSDPDYLSRNNMVLIDGTGSIVPESSADLQDISPGHFPYMIRQQPGPGNALGAVKFVFPNKYDIYLHDTPSKSLFNQSKRAQSHGCIRVYNPLDLAAYLLHDQGWDRKRIDKVIETRELTRVILQRPLDVLLLYWTAGVAPDGRLFFAQDVYERDNDVLRELDREY